MAPNTQQFYQHYNLQQPRYGTGPTNSMYGPQQFAQVMSEENIQKVAASIFQAVSTGHYTL